MHCFKDPRFNSLHSYVKELQKAKGLTHVSGLLDSILQTLKPVLLCLVQVVLEGQVAAVVAVMALQLRGNNSRAGATMV